MYYAEAMVLGRLGAPGKRALLDDPRVMDFLQAREESPWQVLKRMVRELLPPTDADRAA